MKCTWRNKVSVILQPKEAPMTNMTFTPDVSSPLSSGIFSGANVWALTCRGLLAGDVGFDVWRQVRGFRVLAWGQVGRHGCPRCHWRRWISSHWWTGIPRHHSASAWLRKDGHKCLEHQHIYSTREGFHCGKHLWVLSVCPTPLTAACVKAL